MIIIIILRRNFGTLPSPASSTVVTCKHEEHHGIIFEGMSTSVAYRDYRACSCIWKESQLPIIIICSNYLQPPVACD